MLGDVAASSSRSEHGGESGIKEKSPSLEIYSRASYVLFFMLIIKVLQLDVDIFTFYKYYVFINNARIDIFVVYISQHTFLRCRTIFRMDTNEDTCRLSLSSLLGVPINFVNCIPYYVFYP